MNTNANYGLQLIIVYQYWLPITHMQDINNRGNYVGREYVNSLFFVPIFL